MSTSIGLLMVGVIWTWAVAGTLEFTKGGILAGKINDGLVIILLFLYMYGIGKAALMPKCRGSVCLTRCSGKSIVHGIIL